MTDVVDKKTRSRMMAGIRGKNTRPEIIVRSMLHRRGFRFRIHDNSLPGKPDMVLKKYLAVIFVHGCFWHRHECHLFKWPKTRPEFWKNKIDRNHENDIRILNELELSGWRVCLVWECAVKGSGKDLDRTASQIAEWLNNGSGSMEISG